MLTGFGQAVLCLPEQDSAAEEVEPMLMDWRVKRPQGGQPVAQLCEGSSSSSQGCHASDSTQMWRPKLRPLFWIQSSPPLQGLLRKEFVPCVQMSFFSGLQLIEQAYEVGS